MGVMTNQHACEPAASVIAKLGGTTTVAKILDRDESTIRRWRMPKPHGTGGTIPDECKVALIQASAGALTWDDFAPPEIAEQGALTP